MLPFRLGGRKALAYCGRLPNCNSRLPLSLSSAACRQPLRFPGALPTIPPQQQFNPGRVALYTSQSDGKPRSSSIPTKLAAKIPALPKSLHEDIYTIPNLLTLSRLVAAPFVGYFILHDQHAWALGLFAYAGITDLLDGWIARRWNLQTVVGTVIDPMADKTLMTILTVCLAVQGSLPVWLATIILGRDVGLALSAIYYRWISLPPPKTFMRYWDFTLPSAEVRPTTISKYNTFLQLALVGLTTAAPVLSYDLTTPLTIMQYVVAATTVWSGASYIYSKDAVKILTTPKSPPTKS
nr:cdp-diacylglycerol-glycerol-3-phosphate 3-phosphatidyltransferase [Colletotrichum truncatum]KAF6794536.1 cdp-diacylglycerol-glycerol-3-phosphate 3-phosphatidyltransferase [Colletotrichum truncatum]